MLFVQRVVHRSTGARQVSGPGFICAYPTNKRDLSCRTHFGLGTEDFLKPMNSKDHNLVLGLTPVPREGREVTFPERRSPLAQSWSDPGDTSRT